MAENVYLGRWSEHSARGGLIDTRKLERKAARELAELGIDLDTAGKAGRLSIAHQQVVEIARALSYRPRLLILDEPTSSLPAAEVSRLLSLVRRLASQGIAVIYVSHRMDEIPKVADSVTVLRDGRHVSTERSADCTTADVIRLMTGGGGPDAPPRPVPATEVQPVVLRVNGLSTPAKLDGVSFQLHRGEILGLAGLLGSGRTELLRAIYGLDRSSGGIELLGAPLAGGPAASLAAGLALAPEDRKKEALALDMSVSSNLVMACRQKVSRAGFLMPRWEAAITAASIGSLSIKAAAGSAVRTLSGGNQQKVVLGKSLNADIAVFLMDEPTRGVDIEAKSQIYELLRSLATEGVSIVVASSEVEELFLVCHRLLVMSRGRVVAERRVEETTLEETMTLAMEGVLL
ncbi:MAG: sugar ABC transporter ATP-binding protein [Pseudomonadota bacterium]|nr:sugar ABC transporter ATP-binding protein [Pseudomonadota bacterium]